ncbi:MAG: acyl-CoA desaturase [Verrucomicrobiota bacterium]
MGSRPLRIQKTDGSLRLILEMMTAIIVFFLLHCYASVFAQSFFLHRYMAHGMFRMNLDWERFFYLFTFLAQGSSFLHPKSYAALHAEHHKHSDTPEDPHSPHFFKDVWAMMRNTAHVYSEFKSGKRKSNSAYIENLPTWDFVDRLGNRLIVRLVFCVFYALFYANFAPSYWWFLLLPIHFLMGPIHGALVNWCGHKYGYVNYRIKDCSRNTFVWDLLLAGETFQNNHHRFPKAANFASKWFEFDPVYPVIRLMHFLKIIKINHSSL